MMTKGKYWMGLWLIFCGHGTLNAQDFVPSESYKVVNASTKTIWKYAETFISETKPYYTSLVTASDYKDVIFPIKITSPETFDSCFVEELNNHSMKNIGKILKIQIEYASCCYNITTHYLMISKVGDVIELPQFDYVMCDWPCDVPAYEFQKDGKTIKKVINHHGNSGLIESKKYQESLVWNGYKLK